MQARPASSEADWDLAYGWISHLGGGVVLSYDRVGIQPTRYVKTIRKMLEPLKDDVWQAWWISGGNPPCHIFDWTYGARTGCFIRRGPRRVLVRIERAIEDVDEPTLPDVQEARQDVNLMVERLTARFSMPPPPPLPFVDIDAPMSEKDFWEQLEGFPFLDEDLAKDLAASLADLTAGQIKDFECHLQKAFDQASPESSLARRCAVVLAGREQAFRVANGDLLVDAFSADKGNLWLLRVASMAEDMRAAAPRKVCVTRARRTVPRN